MNSILVAGIGNIFLGDDGFGSEVARGLIQRPAFPEVRVADFGIRGLDLAFALVDGWDTTIIVDAMPRGGEPGSIYVVEPDLSTIDGDGVALEAHAMDPMRVLALARSMGAELKNILIVGCEPETFGPPDEGQLGLSPCVAGAVEGALDVIESLIAKHEHTKTKGVTT
jgi:hydrogenase maturation protease